MCAAISLSLVLGFLPICFIFATGVLLSRVAAPDPDPALALPLGIALGTLVLQNVLLPVQSALGELIKRRVTGHSIERLMHLSSSRTPLSLLEQPSVADRLKEAAAMFQERAQTPGDAAVGLIALAARYAQLAGAVALVTLTLGPVPALLVSVSALLARFVNRAALARWTTAHKQVVGVRKQMRYLFNTGSSAGSAKETRMLGVLAWWRQRARERAQQYLHSMWALRRSIYFSPFLGYTLIEFFATIAIFVLVRNAVLNLELSVFGLSVAIQAVLVALRFGVFFPECDVPMQFGMYAQELVATLEAELAALDAIEPTAALSAASDAKPLPEDGAPNRSIVFSGVSFGYDSDREVLSGLDLELRARSSTAIVGLNGSGKTTLVKLLAGLYEPRAGSVSVDGVDLRRLDRRAWQRRLAVIFQDYIRYPFAAADNVALGAPERPRRDEDIRAALALASANFVEGLPKGLETPLCSQFSGGVALSGGEWQRIAIARALYAVKAGASVLVLDEPTAQLDVRAEAAFYESFLDITQGLTSVIISHRFSSVRRADRIVVLDAGRVAEAGTHAELLKRGGRYAKMFELQAERFIAETSHERSVAN